jgi:heme/copper-type cytochrome/quinol oxidase subunit 2
MRNAAGISLLTVTVLTAAIAWPVVKSAVARAQEQNTETIAVTAKKYQFDPSVIHAKAGTKLVLQILATDHVHGFEISTVPDGAPKGSAPGLVLASPPSKDCYRLERGQQLSVQIDAKTAGTYKFKCCVRCGMGHGRMKGELIVDPS